MTDLSSLKDLWLPPIAETVVVDEKGEFDSPFNIMAGLYDEPSAQIQAEYRIDLLKAGHQVICGSARSGKSTLLQTMLYGYISKCKADDLNIFLVRPARICVRIAVKFLLARICIRIAGKSLQTLFHVSITDA